MILCKYAKIGSAIFVPHLDILRAVIMGLRRCGAEVAYSEGYNPHMQLFFNQPLPIGTASECEYFCVHSAENPEVLMAKLNGSLPEGVRIRKAAFVEKDPNVAKIMYSALYSFTMRDKIPNLKQIETLLNEETCVITYEAKGITQSKDVKALLLQLKAISDTKFTAVLRCGNQNLRADRLASYLCDRFGFSCGCDIVKEKMFDEQGRNLDEACFI